MAEQTTNYDLIKPGYDDVADIQDINDNMDSLDDILDGMKTKQTAVADPTADGTAVAFIDSVSQDENGEITVTKKTVKTMAGATSSAAGAAGLVPAPGTSDVGKFLKGDGSYAVPQDTTYGEASSSEYGLIKIGYTQNAKKYPVKLESGKAYVEVPWTDTNTTYNQASSSALGLIKIGYTASGKNYPVQLDANGKAYVNVPWTDTNTTYGEANSNNYGLIKTGYSQNGKNYPVQLSSGKAYVNVPWTDTWRGYSMKTYYASYAVEGNSNVDIPASSFNVSTPSGYTPVAIFLYNSGNTNCMVHNARCDVTGGSAMMNIRNMTGSRQTGNAYIGILYLQT